MMTDNSLLGKTSLLACGLLLALGTTACTQKSFYPYPVPTGYHYNADTLGYPGLKAKAQANEQSTESAPYNGGEAEEYNAYDDDYGYIYDHTASDGDDDIVLYSLKTSDGTLDRTSDNTLDVPVIDEDSMFSQQTVIDRGATPAAWQRAADDLISRMIGELGMPTESIYLRAQNPQDAYNAPFASSLKYALQDQGLNVSPYEGGGPFALTYATAPASYGADQISLSIWLSASYKVANEQDGLYSVQTDMNSAGTTSMDSGRPMMLQP